MPITAITATGTVQIKDKAGYIRAISVSNAGTSWTLKMLDGPDSAGNTSVAYGGTSPGTITTGLAVLSPIYFTRGIQVVTAGTAGEMEIDWA